MLKKICALIMAFAMVASLFAVGASASYNFARGEFRYFIDGEELDLAGKVAAGKTVKVEVTVKNLGDQATYATLGTALYDNLGNMVVVNFADPSWTNKKTIKDLEVTVTAPAVPVDAQYTVKSFVWRNLTTLVPCPTVVTAAPAAPENVTVTETADGNVLAWSAVSAGEVEIYGYNVYRDGSKIATVTTTTYTDTTATTDAEYTVTAYGLNEGKMSQIAEEVIVTDYVTATLDMSEVSDFFSINTLSKNTYTFNGGLNLYVTDNTVSAYDAAFMTNKNDQTFGFCEVTDSTGVTKKCLGSKNLYGERINIAIPDGEILSSETKTLKITVLDNEAKTIYMRYAPNSGSRKDFTFTLEGSGKWVTRSIMLTDTYTSTQGKSYTFELGRGTNASYFKGEVYIADIEISAPKATSAE